MVVTPAPNMTPAPPPPSVVPISQFLVFYPRDSLLTDKKICRHMSCLSPLSTNGTHSYPVLHFPPSNTSRGAHHISPESLPHSFFLFKQLHAW